MKSECSWKTLILGAGCIAATVSPQLLASEVNDLGIRLTEEQRLLLDGRSTPLPGNYDIHTLFSVPALAVPLISVEFTANTNPMKGNTIVLGAEYQSWSIDPIAGQIDRASLIGSVSLQAPLQQALDFSQSIRDKVELCPEKVLDKLLVDGSINLNFSW